MTGQLGSRARLPMIAAHGGGAGLLVAYFLPWVRFGSRLRSSYQLVGSVRRLGFLRGDLVDGIAVLWMFVPLAVIAGWLALALDRPRLAAWVALLVGVYALSFAALIGRAGPMQPGVRLAIAAGTASVGGSILSLFALKGTS
jgi:hypothetical protein